MRIRRSTPGPGLSVGIDLGTTYSAVARVDASGVPEILPNRDGEAITPSVVLFDGEQPIVGTMAKRSVTSAPLDVVQLVKRSMGDRSWRFETAGGTAWRPEEISALILKRLKADAEAVLGSEVSDAVITVPAYFDDAPRRATIDAGTIAGFNVRRVLNEPTAAALAYGMRGDVDGTVLVYDLGGGTFDVTAMRISSGEFRVLATFGDRNLGGFDFDNALIRLLDERFVAAGGRSLLGDDISEVELREKAELAKHALTTVPRTQVSLSVDGFSSVVGVSRADFEDVTSALLSRTREIASMVVEEAGLSWSGVDRVLLAGGSTRMPMVRGMLEQLSGRTPDASANPDQVVAHGAAIQAHLLDLAAAESRSPARIRRPEATGAGLRRLTIHDVTSQGLGALYYERVGNSEREKGNRIVIPANTPIPAHGTNTWKTLRDNQSAINWVVTQGNDDDPRYVRRVGTGSTPLPLYPAGSEVELTFSYDHNQIIEITARDLTSGHSIGGFTVDGVQNMSADDVARSERRIRPIDPV